MIKFFRKIRQRLLTENKFSKYLLYAFGEIVLVVIGILIALQINNWNEKHQAQNKMENNFQNLIEDLKSNKLQLLNLIERRNEVANGASLLIDNYENEIQVDENDFVEKLYPVLSEKYFEINRNGIDKVITSPAFEREQMETIRDLIKSYLQFSSVLNKFEIKEGSAVEHMEMITAGNGYFRTVWKTFRKNRYKTTTEYNSPDFDFLKIMKNDELLYLLFRYELVTQTASKYRYDLIEKGDEIIKAIEDYRK
ncbi:DUF6090 family protein [Psychroserpens sp. SPM9]|uniref:DUF6090 family protein n=1 Tax=Psychroserpens sp. SPM9 TaxID=2975598 RepID=UPI0021A32496|nr:DUF6090 family protein [Psychroserpens sp. SPM9]MDG5492009.1 DUF6090 family protein [Psychroserpens sp. SPM9]